jgi:hypothetical protein
MHPELKKLYEDYFDRCFRESVAIERPWVGLTDEEKQKFLGGDAYGATLHDINAIEAKLKEKNCG